MRPTTLTLGTRQVGEGQPCFVLAEVASAHGGSADVALRMLESAFKMGADGIKFQLFRSELLVVARHPGRKDFDQIELDAARVAEGPARGQGLRADRARRGLRPSLLAPGRGRGASTATRSTPRTWRTPTSSRRWGRCGGRCSSRPAASPRTRCARPSTSWATRPSGLLHGFQTFPTPIEEIRFRELTAWKDRYRVPVGFLDHTDGGSAFALVAPALAVGYGADLVEKHFTLDRSEKGFDYQSSLNPEDFYRMVELLRQAERAAGDGPAAESEGAKRYHRVMARSIVAGQLIPRGEVLTLEMLAFKRTDVRFDPGFPPRSADRVIGRRAARPIQADETIREDMLQ